MRFVQDSGQRGPRLENQQNFLRTSALPYRHKTLFVLRIASIWILKKKKKSLGLGVYCGLQQGSHPVWRTWGKREDLFHSGKSQGKPLQNQCGNVDTGQFQQPNVTPGTERNFWGGVANCMHLIGCSFWVTFRSWSYVWLLKLSTVFAGHVVLPDA